MKIVTSTIASFIFILIIQSCQKHSTKETKNAEIVDTLPHADIEEESEETTKDSIVEPNVSYPETGNKISDFLPKTGIYKVQYKAEGDLNNDGLNDIAVVLKHTQSNLLKRPILILLQNEDQTYRLDKVSNVVMPIEYNEYDFKFYDPEDIKIEEGALRIYLFGSPNNMILCKFKYTEKDLVLTYMTSYSGGAGERIETTDDYEKGEGTTIDINTMHENSIPVSKKYKIKAAKHLFENTSVFDLYNGEDSPPS